MVLGPESGLDAPTLAPAAYASAYSLVLIRYDDIHEADDRVHAAIEHAPPCLGVNVLKGETFERLGAGDARVAHSPPLSPPRMVSMLVS
jgi:hypothetical protein